MVPYYCCNNDLFFTLSHRKCDQCTDETLQIHNFTPAAPHLPLLIDHFPFPVEHIIRSLKVMHASFFIFHYQIPWMTGLSWFQSNLYFFNLTSGIWQSTVSTLLLHALFSYVAVLYPYLLTIQYPVSDRVCQIKAALVSNPSLWLVQKIRRGVGRDTRTKKKMNY